MQLIAGLAMLVATASSQRVVPISIGKSDSGAGASILRPRTPFSEMLANNLTGGGYYAKVQVGTPGQTITMQIDTGSSDVWMLSQDADLCHDKRLKEIYGDCTDTFDPSKSSTYKLLAQDGFTITYADSSGVSGDYFSDNLSIDGADTIKALQMGLGKNSTINTGLMGIGFDTDEASTTVYPSIIDQMQSQGLIGIKAYSLYLNDLQSSTGTILFGGIDTGKYTGSLKAVPIEPDSESHAITSFTVTLSSLVAVSDNGTSINLAPSAIPVILDSGTTLTYLPQEVANNIQSMLQAYDDTDDSGLVLVDCSHLVLDQSLAFQFQFGATADGPVINVPISEVVINDVSAYLQSGQIKLPSELPFTSANACSLGIRASSAPYILGDTFLRSAYVVYDLTHNEIALAQSSFNSTLENIIEIPASATGIPLVSGTTSQHSGQQTATGTPGNSSTQTTQTTLTTRTDQTTQTIHSTTQTTQTTINKPTTTNSSPSNSASGASQNGAKTRASVPNSAVFAVAGLTVLHVILSRALFVI
ncbi:aspartic peptidase domain-containing protein [Diplogelasinospora grovesii]|uniref:Aspartic peptidase domain-containing protein n=1 Tax=Diplogelasinospora grovesii TaxID=303347 RepID=A0AAN6MYI2_9PEZI|nr:aspartic peptidase domain-containing protein [Diplogelasinospora grovesii]